MIEQPLQRIRTEALACLRRRALADKRRLRIRHCQSQIIQYFTDGLVAIERQRYHQPDHLFGRKPSMADAGGICALHGLFNPLDGKVLSKSTPVG